jgi:hypothetical protein
VVLKQTSNNFIMSLTSKMDRSAMCDRCGFWKVLSSGIWGHVVHCTRFCLPTAFTLVSCLAYSFMLKMEVTCSSTHWLSFNRIHGIMSQKTELFITTTVRTSNPTYVVDLICDDK